MGAPVGLNPGAVTGGTLEMSESINPGPPAGLGPVAAAGAAGLGIPKAGGGGGLGTPPKGDGAAGLGAAIPAMGLRGPAT